MRTVRRVAIAMAGIVALTALGLWTALHVTRLEPPSVAAGVDLSLPGPGRAERRSDIWFVWLAGAPEVRGADMYRLLGDAMGRVDATMHETFADVVPSRPARFAIEMAGRLFSRHLSHDIPEDVQREIVGQVHAYPDPFGDGGGKFARFMSYLALHDLSQTIERSPLYACSGFAATGAATVSGKTIVGRNFDFEAGPIFDREKSVTVFSAPHKLRLASVAWPGMNGVVTGINERRVWVSVNAARSDDESGRGLPVSLLIRRVLEEAQTAADAAVLIERLPSRVADLFLVADPTQAMVVEKTPRRAVVRQAGPSLVVANHFLEPGLRQEARNQWLEGRTTSLVRHERLSQLVLGRASPLDAAQSLAVLRDRTAPDGALYPFGDRRALDGYIATHGAFADLGEDVLWVSRAPHLSNGWVGVRLAPLFAGQLELAGELPADAAALALGSQLGERKPNQ